VIHTQGVRPGAGQITISYQLIIESEPTPPAEDPVSPPSEETVAPPAEEPTPPSEEPTPPSEEPTPPSEEPTAPPAEEPASPSPTEPSAPEPEQVSSQPDSPQAPTQEPSPIAEALAPIPVQDIDAPVVTEIVPENPEAIASTSIATAPENPFAAEAVMPADEIIAQPSPLRQAAQNVEVPLQTNSQPWSSNSLFAGLIGLALFALIAGLVVARRGVPGAIAS
jgi:hypothetical protein